MPSNTPELTADQPVIRVDPSMGQNDGVTIIHYDGGSHETIYLWARFDTSQPWNRLNLFQLVGTPDADHKGKFSTPAIPLGRFYELRMYAEDSADPNTNSGLTPVRELLVLVVLKRSTRDIRIQDQGEVTGGTFHAHTVSTAVETNFAIEISIDPPLIDADGWQHFAKPLHAHTEPYATLHRAELDDLMPGTTYFCLVRISDNEGNWKFIATPIRTLMRRVTVNFTKLHIINDGDPMGRGEASFSFQVWEGANKVREFALGDDNYEITDGQTIPLNFTHTVGPKVITPDIYDMWVRLSGTEYDGWFEDDEHAEMWREGKLIFPVGWGKETVLNSPRTFQANPPIFGGDFRFKVEAMYSVEYI